MVSTTLGAVAGPNSVEALGALATSLGIPALAGPFLLAAVAYALAGAVLFAFLRPDPYLVARSVARHEEEHAAGPARQAAGTPAAPAEPRTSVVSRSARPSWC